MDWDQRLFKRILAFASRVRRLPPQFPDAAFLADRKDRLTIAARLLTGEPVEIVTAESEGGLRGHIFFLPAEYNGFADRTLNECFYLFRICCLAEQKRLGLNWSSEGHSEGESSARALSALPVLLSRLARDFPLLAPFLDALIRAELGSTGHLKRLAGKWMAPLNSAGLAQTGRHRENEKNDSARPDTELEGRTRETIRTHTPNLRDIEDYTLMHNFEKVETIEEFQGNWREMDGSDDLKTHEEALRELDLRDTVRVDTPVHSVYRTEFFVNASAPESRDQAAADFFVPYDEWDYKKQVYRPDHCRIYPQNPRRKAPGYVQSALSAERGTLSRLRRMLNGVHNELEKVRRQVSGEEPDLDALVDNFAELHAGRTPSENIYLSRRKRRRDLSVLILLDTSLSTDAYTGGERILDVEKRSVALLGELLEEAGDEFAIGAFYSKTRSRIDWIDVKRFDESWSSARGSLGGLEACGYTRIGPAIRHACAQILRRDSRKRWILLLSDGKPNDYDRYEGRYGMEDVRKALKEARRSQVNAFALAVEAEARHYLPVMLGQGRYRILPKPSLLPEALGEFYARLRMSA